METTKFLNSLFPNVLTTCVMDYLEPTDLKDGYMEYCTTGLYEKAILVGRPHIGCWRALRSGNTTLACDLFRLAYHNNPNTGLMLSVTGGNGLPLTKIAIEMGATRIDDAFIEACGRTGQGIEEQIVYLRSIGANPTRCFDSKLATHSSKRIMLNLIRYGACSNEGDLETVLTAYCIRVHIDIENKKNGIDYSTEYFYNAFIVRFMLECGAKYCNFNRCPGHAFRQ